ncbi:hypothetical protein K7432_006939 [Basidiobolus ranarum]|uniref:L-2-hydroxyglutarate dehydrogenase, mitochondrial n=1 Tax=Basidiobolus ranarum TaxID=34480 RepID=A0ABR2W0V0_9FUNG
MYKVAARFSLKNSSCLNGISLKKSVLSAKRYISNTPEFTVDHLVIGGGVVGLAVAERLSRHSKSSTILVEKNSRIGEETSSRNSEVIHAGLYYPEDSLKTSLCIRGKNMLYDFCKEYSVPHSQITKWVVAKNEEQAEYLIRLEEKAKRLNVPVEFISLKDRERLEPAVKAREALVSPTTGIVDSHGLMERLEWLINENGADIACMTSVE